jgi:transcription antitermination factor NusG
MSARNGPWPWFAILTKTGREKGATLLLENSGFECCLPVGKSIRKWSDRNKEMEVPLFPGYFFCRMNPNDRLPVLKTPIPVEEQEIAAIQRAGRSGLTTMPWPYLRVGQVARINDGPLRGMSGIVVRIKTGLKLVLSVNLLQRSIAVEIDRNWISAAYPASTTEHRTTAGLLNAAPKEPIQTRVRPEL